MLNFNTESWFETFTVKFVFCSVQIWKIQYLMWIHKEIQFTQFLSHKKRVKHNEVKKK